MKVLFGCASILVVSWQGVLLPIDTEIEALHTRLASQQQETQRARTALGTLPALEREIRDLERTASVLGPIQMPRPSGPSSALIKDLQSAAATSNLTLTSLRPRDDAVPAGRPGEGVELGIEGKFRDVSRFLAHLSALPRVMTTPEFVIKAHADSPVSNRTVIGSIVVVAFDVRPEKVDPVAFVGHDEDAGRDPFASEVERPSHDRPSGAPARGGGLATRSLGDVVVRGLLRDGERRLAILETTDRRSFVVRTDDRLADAIVHVIDGSGVVFLKDAGSNEPARIHRPIARWQGGRQ